MSVILVPSCEIDENKLMLAQQLFRSGQLIKCKQIYQEYLSLCSNQHNSYKKQINSLCSSSRLQISFNILINLSTIQLQLNNLSNAYFYIDKCIQLLPFNYMGYYSKALICLSKEQYIEVYKYMKIALSCLLRQIVQINIDNKNNIKNNINNNINNINDNNNNINNMNHVHKDNQYYYLLVKRCIKLAKNNLKAYLISSKLQQYKNKIKLAQNDIENAIFILQQQSQSQIDHNLLQSLYLEKVFFYRRINNQNKIKDAFKQFIKIKEDYNNKYNKNKFRIVLENTQMSNLTRDEVEKEIIILAKQIKDRIEQLNNINIEGIKKQQNTINNNRNNKINININRNIVRNQRVASTRTQSQNNNILYQSSYQNISHINNNNNNNNKNNNNNNSLLQSSSFSQIHPQRPSLFPLGASFPINQSPMPNPLQIYQQQNLLLDQPTPINQSSTVYQQDQDSVILNQKIEQLQNQIKQSGGRINVSNIDEDSIQKKDGNKINQQEDGDFLESQIQKNMQEIINIKKQQAKRNRVNSYNNNRISINMTNNNNNINIQTNSTSSKSQPLTLKSILSQKILLSQHEIKQYKSFKLQIRSLSMFDQKMNKKQSFIKAKYHQKIFQTDKCKNDKFTWNQNFKEQMLIHDLQDNQKIKQFQSFQENYYIHVEVYVKQTNWFGKSTNNIIGKGVIKLTSKGETKCTIQNKNQKIGILYYKIKLNKNQ